MTTELATVDFTDEQLDLIKRTVAGPAKLTHDEFRLFCWNAQRLGLDPLTRQVYAMKQGGRMTVITGIDGFRIIAQRTGEYAGQIGPEWFVNGEWTMVPSRDAEAARVGVYRKGFKEPVFGVASRSEFNSGGGSWKKMPAHMLAKVAESHALRKAFPDHLYDVYTQDEIDGANGQQQPATGSSGADDYTAAKVALGKAVAEWTGKAGDDLKAACVLLMTKADDDFAAAGVTTPERVWALVTNVRTFTTDGAGFAEVTKDGGFFDTFKLGSGASTDGDTTTVAAADGRADDTDDPSA